MPAADGAARGGRRASPARVARDLQEARLEIDVRPRAATSGVELGADGVLRVRVAAPPVEGAANRALRRLLAETLDCPPSALEIVQGERGRRKVIRVRGISADAIRRRLAMLG
jgi:uncharacterized protein